MVEQPSVRTICRPVSEAILCLLTGREGPGGGAMLGLVAQHQVFLLNSRSAGGRRGPPVARIAGRTATRSSERAGAQADDLRAVGRDRRRADDVAARAHRRRRATGTTATAGCATRRSRCARSSSSATREEADGLPRLAAARHAPDPARAAGALRRLRRGPAARAGAAAPGRATPARGRCGSATTRTGSSSSTSTAR